MVHPNIVSSFSSDDSSDDEQFRPAAAAAAFYPTVPRTLDTRANSRIYYMRTFNNWVKATQIQELNPHTPAGGKPLRVLDLACGKGGDLGKWILHPRTIANYVGIDVALGSLQDAAIRARAIPKLKRCTFTCADLGSDVPGRYASSKTGKKKKLKKLRSWSLQGEPPNSAGDPEFRRVRGGGISLEDRFDVVSIQFAIHYMMSSRKRARRFFHTVSELLDVGGNLIATTIDARVVVQHLMNLGLELHFDDAAHFDAQPYSAGSKRSCSNDNSDDAVIRVGNGACQIRFAMDKVRQIFSTRTTGEGLSDDLFGLEYTFTLVEGSEHSRGVGDAVNLPEWLAPLPVLTSLAKEAGLELVYDSNFHDFYAERSDPKFHSASHDSLCKMKVLNRNGSIAPDEWEISRLYVAIKFRKERESTMNLEDEDATTARMDDFDDENNSQEDPSVPAAVGSTSKLDPATKAKLDPATKAKLLPMAMMNAKRSVGDEKWKSLTSDEKTLLTGAELRKLAGAASATAPK
jgi:mRNA (guanine-N7-)-methyltransferase